MSLQPPNVVDHVEVGTEEAGALWYCQSFQILRMRCRRWRCSRSGSAPELDWNLRCFRNNWFLLAVLAVLSEQLVATRLEAMELVVLAELPEHCE